MTFLNSETIDRAIGSLSRYYYDLDMRHRLDRYPLEHLKILSVAYLIKVDYDKNVAKKALQYFFPL